MDRIPWTRYSGEDIEQVIGVLLCTEDRRVQMIRPGQGDGGLDLIVPVDEGRHDVYQVKRFAEKIHSSEERQIRRSYKSLLKTIERGEIKVRRWYPTMPLDPTPKNLAWLAELTRDAPFEAEWRGRLFVETLATNYPHVIDHYFGGGRERIQQAVKDALQMVTGRTPAQNEAGLAPMEALQNTAAAVGRASKEDPHFVYGISVDPNEPKPSGDCVAMVTRFDEASQMWLCIRVYTRFDDALSFRPLTLRAQFRAEPGTLLASDLAAYEKYGRPFAVPEGVKIQADLPGGLGGEFTGAFKITLPDGETRRHRLLLGKSDHSVIAEVEVDLRKPRVGRVGTGMYTKATDLSGAVDIEMLVDNTGSMTVTPLRHPLNGKIAAEVAPAMRFLRLLPDALLFGMVPKHGPQDVMWASVNGDQEAHGEDFTLLAEYVEALAAIQEMVPFTIKVPAETETPVSLAREIVSLGALVRGEVVEVPHPLSGCGEGLAFDTEGSFAMTGEQEVSFQWEGQEAPLPPIHLYSPKVRAEVHQTPGHEGHDDFTLRPAEGHPWRLAMDRSLLPISADDPA